MIKLHMCVCVCEYGVYMYMYVCMCVMCVYVCVYAYIGCILKNAHESYGIIPDQKLSLKFMNHFAIFVIANATLVFKDCRISE